MKARLLKRLRRNFSSNYRIIKGDDKYELLWRTTGDRKYYDTLEEAKWSLKRNVQLDILLWLKRKNKKRIIKYYAW